jgi:membrane protein DedA with SNARE-associated domain
VGGRPAIVRWGRFVLLDIADLDRAERFFGRFGPAAVFVARLLPVVRTFIALPAGIARMPQLPFQLYTFVGSYLWCLALAYVGEQLGARWDSDPRLKAILHRLDAVIVVLVLAAIVWFVWHRLRRRPAVAVSGRTADRGPGTPG